MLNKLCNGLQRLTLVLVLSLTSVFVNAEVIDAKNIDVKPLKLTKVNDYVYSAIGVTRAPSYENRGHNNNLSVVISNNGVLVVNGSDNYLLAKSLHKAIKQITDQPVVWVVNENGQGHAFLGNSYWSQQPGVKIIAHQEAIDEVKHKGEISLERMQKRNKDQAAGTFVFAPTESFTDKKVIQLGDLTIELLHFGKAHSTGDISVWLPKDRIIIAGDIAFHQRMLAVFPETDSKEWLVSFKKMQALKPLVVIPGHGSPTDIETITHYTYDYIKFLRDAVEEILDDDGDLSDAYKIDQSQWKSLEVFDVLAAKNAGRVFQQMEMEAFE